MDNGILETEIEAELKQSELASYLELEERFHVDLICPECWQFLFPHEFLS